MVAKLTFFQNDVPGRDTFKVTWACCGCASFPDGKLWAPLAEAAYSPTLVASYDGASGCFGDVTCLKPFAQSQFDTAAGSASPGSSCIAATVWAHPVDPT